MPPSVVRELLRLLPERHGRNRQSLAPSFEEFVELAEEFPALRFHGYRIASRRADERITIEGYYYPDRRDTERLYDRVSEMAAPPDEYGRWGYDDGPGVRAWWD